MIIEEEEDLDPIFTGLLSPEGDEIYRYPGSVKVKLGFHAECPEEDYGYEYDD